jgi:hypothetical protein
MAHEHDLDCLEQDVEDMTNASGGEAWTYLSCKVTGETHKTLEEFGLINEPFIQ